MRAREQVIALCTCWAAFVTRAKSPGGGTTGPFVHTVSGKVRDEPGGGVCWGSRDPSIEGVGLGWSCLKSTSFLNGSESFQKLPELGRACIW